MSADLLSKEHVLGLTERFVALANSLNDPPAAERIQPALQQYRLGLFRVVVMGEIKKGKSSFINALLGEHHLLPTLSDVATSTVYKIMYGDTRKYKVFFLPKEDGATPDPVEISREQMADYGTEDGNPDNRKGVEFIGVQLPHPLLKTGIVIIDTPGLGGLFRKHRDITWRYVPTADAIFFLFDSVEAVASRDEVECLQKLRKMTQRLFFAQTKTDLVEPERWQQWRDRNLDIVSQALETPKEKLFYFPISSQLKMFADQEQSATDLTESGFVPLLDFINNHLLKAKERLLAGILLNGVNIEVRSFHQRLSDELQVLNTETKAGLDVLEQEFAETKSKFEKWRTTEYQRTLQDFQVQSSDLKRTTLDDLQNALDPSGHGPIAEPIMESLRASQADARTLNNEAGAVQSLCIDQCSQIIFDIQGRYNAAMEDLIGATSQKLGKSYARTVSTMVKGASVATVQQLNMHFSRFESTRNTFYGGTAGGAIAGIAAAIIFPPAAAGIFVANLIGFVMGSVLASRDLQARRREEALGKLQGILMDTVRQAQKQAIQQFNATATEYERAAGNAFENAAAQVSQELQNRLTTIAASRKRTRDDNLQKAAAIKNSLGQVDKLLNDLTQSLGQPTNVPS